MKEQINEQDIEQVTGGTVVFNKRWGNVSFSTTGDKYTLKNCSVDDAWSLVERLRETHRNLSEEEFDNLIRTTFEGKGWI